MVVETFIDRNELEHLTDEKETESYNKLCVDLGLEHLAIGEDTQVNGIPKMNKLEREVYSYLCPTKTEIEKYTGVLPKRVLEAYKICKDNGWLEEADRGVHIWTAKENPDPIMIVKFDYNDYGMIARWGDELRSFAELRKEAVRRKKIEVAKKIEEARSIVKLFDEDPNSLVESIILGNTGSIYF